MRVFVSLFLLARKSNLKKGLKQKQFLLRCDVVIHRHLLVITIVFWSKTIQYGERLLHNPLVAIPQSILCPVLAFKRMCSYIKASAEDPYSYFQVNALLPTRCFKIS